MAPQGAMLGGARGVKGAIYRRPRPSAAPHRTVSPPAAFPYITFCQYSNVLTPWIASLSELQLNAIIADTGEGIRVYEIGKKTEQCNPEQCNAVKQADSKQLV